MPDLHLGHDGAAEGVEHTHDNFLAMGRSHVARFPITPDDRAVSYLPTAHLADRGILYYFHSIYGAAITMCPNMADLGAALAQVRPTTFAAVPRVWEKLKQGAEAALAADPALQAAFDRGDDAVLSAIRSRLGFDELRWALSGSATLNAEVLAFLNKIGVPTTDIWGMSEIGIATAAPIELAKAGTVGFPMEGYECRLAADGEMLVRADFLMKCYRKDPVKTADTIDQDGWLHTGDIFAVDDEGYYSIIDKKKELIINSGGKNMSPSNIEGAVRDASRLVGPMMVYGDNRPFNVALITIEAEVAPDLGVTATGDDLYHDPVVVATIRQAVADGNAHLSRIEQIKRFKIVPEGWHPGTPMVTPTGKLKRRVLNEKYAADIEDLYAATLIDGVHEPAPAVTSTRRES
ncbi:hypothetical protein MTP03_08450 [Tsukamurella sp. PLM1]|nr:hypothetical protein MTP03_08450 [Tsukamurella sp. PLM1]